MRLDLMTRSNSIEPPPNNSSMLIAANKPSKFKINVHKSPVANDYSLPRVESKAAVAEMDD